MEISIPWQRYENNDAQGKRIRAAELTPYLTC